MPPPAWASPRGDVAHPPAFVQDQRARAAAALDANFFAGAGAGATLRRNELAFQRFLLAPRLADTVTVDPSARLFGVAAPMPLAVAPVGSLNRIGPDAWRALAEAAGETGIPVCVSHADGIPPADWRRATASPLVFVTNFVNGFDRALRGVQAAVDAGFDAIGLTVDTVVPQQLGSQVLQRSDGSPRTGRAFRLAELDELRRRVTGHLAVKGVLDPADARRVVDAGADTVVVSNHGGRLLDRAPATLEALPAVVAEVGGEADVLVDGGVRSAADVAVAVALGARAALIGRPVCWAVVDGRPGVAALFDFVLADFRRVLAATASPTVADLGPRVLRPASFAGLDAFAGPHHEGGGSTLS